MQSSPSGRASGTEEVEMGAVMENPERIDAADREQGTHLGGPGLRAARRQLGDPAGRCRVAAALGLG